MKHIIIINDNPIVLEPWWPPTPYEIELAIAENELTEEEGQCWYEMIGADWNEREEYP